MFNDDWWNAKVETKELCVGWLYNDRISNSLLNGISQNIAEYDSVEFGLFCDQQFVDEKISGLLTQAYNAGYSKIVVFKQGTVHKYFERVFPEFYEKHLDSKFIGHILDKGDEYFWIHPQCFLIDLDWWAEAGMPEWGDEHDSGPWETTKPIRSTQNHHDKYTPYWVKPVSEPATYTHKNGGWNLVKALLDDNQTIHSWDQSLRQSKEYLYAEVRDDAWRNIFYLHEQMDTQIFFVGNTEIPDTETNNIGDKDQKFTKVVAPSAGISPMLYAKNLRLPPGSTIIIYDISTFALDCMQQLITEWDGTNYTEYMNKMMDSKCSYYSRKDELFRGQQQLQDTQKLLDSMPEWQEWWRDTFSTFNIQYEQTNLMNPNRYTSFAKWSANYSAKGLTYVHLSNIFHYYPTAVYYSLEQRVIMYNELFAKLKFYSNNNIVAKCTSPLLTQDQIAGPIKFVENHTSIDFENLPSNTLGKMFKWNK